jgi:hypothetical protein
MDQAVASQLCSLEQRRVLSLVLDYPYGLQYYFDKDDSKGSTNRMHDWMRARPEKDTSFATLSGDVDNSMCFANQKCKLLKQLTAREFCRLLVEAVDRVDNLLTRRAWRAQLLAAIAAHPLLRVLRLQGGFTAAEQWATWCSVESCPLHIRVLEDACALDHPALVHLARLRRFRTQVQQFEGRLITALALARLVQQKFASMYSRNALAVSGSEGLFAT